MSTLTLSEADHLVLAVTPGTSVVIATLLLKGVAIVTATALRNQVLVLASGMPCLAVGGTHFPLALDHLKEVAAFLGLPLRGQDSTRC